LRNEVESYSDLRAAIKRHSGEELDITPYEADMRHLLNTYVQADPAAARRAGGQCAVNEALPTFRCFIPWI